jgi:ArsR family transcriptional regulator, arsenate/arsenite/antimonite-responsive transcriptional repressor
MNDLLKALSDPTRREILHMLRKRDMNAGEIADAFNMSKPSISHHLDMLKKTNLVQAVKEGQFINYSINTTELDELIRWIYKITGKK